jgi:predicted transcriptional regulator
MQANDMKVIIESFRDALEMQTEVNRKVMERMELFGRTVLMVLETQNRIIDSVPQWIRKAEKGEVLSQKEIDEINRYTEQLLNKKNGTQ